MSHEHVEKFMPKYEDMKEGVLYISKHFMITNHFCPCGCGQETIVPINKEGWSLTTGDEGPTLTPSISRRDGCKSHYFIRNGKVVWA